MKIIREIEREFKGPDLRIGPELKRSSLTLDDLNHLPLIGDLQSQYPPRYSYEIAEITPKQNTITKRYIKGVLCNEESIQMLEPNASFLAYIIGTLNKRRVPSLVYTLHATHNATVDPTYIIRLSDIEYYETIRPHCSVRFDPPIPPSL